MIRNEYGKNGKVANASVRNFFIIEGDEHNHHLTRRGQNTPINILCECYNRIIKSVSQKRRIRWADFSEICLT